MRGTPQRGSALLIALATLALMSAFAVGLVSIVRLEAAASLNSLDDRRATLAAEAGVNRALAELSATFDQPLTSTIPTWAYLDRKGDYGHGVAFADAGRISFWSVDSGVRGSVGLEDGSSLSFSGSLGSTYSEGGDVYSLKVIDCTTQIDLNDERPDLAKMLDTLGVAIAEQRGRDPVRGRGAEIVALRDRNGRLNTKREISSIVGPDDWKLLADFVTVDGWADPAARRPLTAKERDPAVEDMSLPRFAPERRCPINVNSAPKAVLVALFAGVGTRSGDPITLDQARRLADAIVQRRKSLDPTEGPFMGIVSLEEFILSLSSAGSQAILTPEQAAALCANLDPNLRVVEVNPDTAARLPASKYDLDYRTTEAAFFPHGTFEVVSLGRVIARGRILAESYRMAVIRAYSVARHTTQVDFEGAALEDTTDNVAALPNQTRRLGGWAASADDGYVQLSDPEAQIGIELTGLRLFQSAYTGTLDGSDQKITGGTFLGSTVPGFFDPKTGMPKKGGSTFVASTAPNGGNFPALGQRLEDKLVLSGGDLYCDGTHSARSHRRLWYAVAPPVDEGTIDLWLKVDQDTTSAPGSVVQAVNVLSNDVVLVTELTAGSDGSALTLELNRKAYFASSTSIIPYNTGETRTRAVLKKLGTYGEWHHVVIAWRSGTEAELYVDGALTHDAAKLGLDMKNPSWPPPCALPAEDSIVVGGHDTPDGPLWRQLTVDDVVIEGAPAHIPHTFLEPERYPARDVDFVGRFIGSFGPFDEDVEFGTIYWTERDPKSWGKVQFTPADFQIEGLVEGIKVDLGHDGKTKPPPKPKGPQPPKSQGKALGHLRPELAMYRGVPAPGERSATYEIRFKYARDNLLLRGIVVPPLNVSPILDDVTLVYRTRPTIVRTETDED